MKCPTCKATLTPDDRFCSACGAELPANPGKKPIAASCAPADVNGKRSRIVVGLDWARQHRWPVLACGAGIVALLALLFFVLAPSKYNRNARTALVAARGAVAAVEDGTITYGDCQRVNSELDKIEHVLPTCRGNSESSDVEASRNLFEASFGVIASKFEVLETSKFLEAELRKVGEGGLSPGYTAEVGVDDISEMKEELESLEKAYKDLR